MAIGIQVFTNRLSPPEMAELSNLLALSMGNPSEAAVNKVVESYKPGSGRDLFFSRKGALFTGCIGLKSLGNRKYEIEHLAVARDLRKKGLGKVLVEDAVRRLKIGELIAESDGDAVDFYLKLGFTVLESVPNQWGIKRFKLKRVVSA